MRPRRGPRSDDRLESHSDAELLNLVRERWITALRTLYRRHYPAVFGYAAHCADCPADAHRLARQAYTEVLRATVLGAGAVSDRRHRGCLRLRLLVAVRSAAVQQSQSAQEPGMSLTPRFRSWVARGCQWPLHDSRSLMIPFTSLPESAQCLLWHAVVERDEPALVVRVTGLSPDRLAPMTEQAMDTLREAVVDAYSYSLRVGEDCHKTAEQLVAAARPDGLPVLRGIAPHLQTCSACLAVYTDVKELTTRLQRMLPPLLLGWWPGDAYRATKASTAPPQHEPRFLERILLGSDIKGPLPEPASQPEPDLDPDSVPGSLPGPAPEAVPADRDGGPPWHGPGASGRRYPPAVRSGALGATGLAAMLVALVCTLQADPAAPSAPPVPADTYAVQVHTAAGSGEHPRARALGPFSWLRYDRVDFTDTAATRFSAGIVAPAGRHGVLEVRLDSLAARPVAMLAPPADGSLGEVTVPIPATKGVHEVFLTARCSPSLAPCTEVLWFGAGQWAADPFRTRSLHRSVPRTTTPRG
ncbi:carbohydrate-binding protein [Streptomyces sp. 8N616]|uniref:carbohydrate-binding protein n=1 Tax=Streptomyces sp. 8N616 TaxID=3457414 RepID=UPI003FD2DD85